MSLPQRKSPRLPEYDYSLEGGYFVTLCTHDKKHIFGYIRDAKMFLTDIGRIAYERWLMIPRYYPSVGLSDFVIMPNHLHGILFLSASSDERPVLSNIVAGYKSGVTRVVHQQTNFTSTVWQYSFHDHIIRNEIDLIRIREYVLSNPARWEADTFYTR